MTRVTNRIWLSYVTSEIMHLGISPSLGFLALGETSCHLKQAYGKELRPDNSQVSELGSWNPTPDPVFSDCSPCQSLKGSS